MSLYADWKQTIEDNSQTAAGQRAFWDGFCEREKHIYEDLLGRQEARVAPVSLSSTSSREASRRSSGV